MFRKENIRLSDEEESLMFAALERLRQEYLEKPDPTVFVQVRNKNLQEPIALSINHAADEVLGYTKIVKGIGSTNFLDGILLADLPDVTNMLEGALTSRRSQEATYRLNVGSEIRYVHATAKKYVLTFIRYFFSGRDIQDFVKISLEDSTAQKVAEDQAIKLADIQNLSDVYESLVTGVAPFIGAQNATLLVMDPQGSGYVAERFFIPSNGLKPRAPLFGVGTHRDEIPTLQFMYHEKSPFIVNNRNFPHPHFTWLESSNNPDWLSVIGFPLIKDEIEYGYLFFSSPKANHFTDRHLNIIDAAVPAIVSGIETFSGDYFYPGIGVGQPIYTYEEN